MAESAREGTHKLRANINFDQETYERLTTRIGSHTKFVRVIKALLRFLFPKMDW